MTVYQIDNLFGPQEYLLEPLSIRYFENRVYFVANPTPDPFLRRYIGYIDLPSGAHSKYHIAGDGTTNFWGTSGTETDPKTASDHAVCPSGIDINATSCLIADTYFSKIRSINFSSDIISTLVNQSPIGSLPSGYSGDTRKATSAKINYATGVCFLSSGGFLVADTLNHRIRKVDSRGIITTIAGNGISGYAGDGGEASSASLSFPQSVAVDSSSNIYIADTGNYRVRKIAADGTISTLLGNGDSSIIHPFDLVVNSTTLFVADCDNNRIWEAETSGAYCQVIANSSGHPGYYGNGTSATDALLNGPRSVSYDAVSGQVFVADTLNCAIRVLTPIG